MAHEKGKEAEIKRLAEDSGELSPASGVQEDVRHRRAAAGASASGSDHEVGKTGSRPKKGCRWRFLVCRIDPGKYPGYANDRDHVFVRMEPIERLAEIGAFCGLLWARACREAKEDCPRQIRRAA